MKTLTLVLLTSIILIASLLVYWSFVDYYPHGYPYLFLVLIVNVVSYLVIIQRRHRRNYQQIVKDIDAVRRMIIHHIKAEEGASTLDFNAISILLYLTREAVEDCMRRSARDSNMDE